MFEMSPLGVDKKKKKKKKSVFAGGIYGYIGYLRNQDLVRTKRIPRLEIQPPYIILTPISLINFKAFENLYVTYLKGKLAPFLMVVVCLSFRGRELNEG